MHHKVPELMGKCVTLSVARMQGIEQNQRRLARYAKSHTADRRATELRQPDDNAGAFDQFHRLSVSGCRWLGRLRTDTDMGCGAAVVKGSC